jgi:hypothetical protein
MANVLTGAMAGVVGNRRLSELPAVLRQGLSSVAAYVGQARLRSEDMQGEVDVDLLRARGDDFGAQRQGVQNALAIATRSGGPEAEAAKDRATAQGLVINRNQNLYRMGLGTALNVSAAQAMGTEYGGYQETAQVRGLAGGIMQQYAAAGTPQDRATIGQTGLNLLTGLQRDIQQSGSVSEAAAGTLGAGFSDSGDQATALRELTDAIKALNDTMSSGAGGTSGGGEDLDNY